MTLIPKGAHLASATVPWYELFFLPRPENQGIFSSASNKKYQIPNVALVDVNPDGRHCLFHSFSLPSSILKVLNNMQKGIRATKTIFSSSFRGKLIDEVVLIGKSEFCVTLHLLDE